MSDTEWSEALTAAYRKWLFTGPEGDLDTTDEDWLSDLQERAFEGGWAAALATTGGETEWEYRIKGPNSVGRAFTGDLAEAEVRLRDFDKALKYGNVHHIQKRERRGKWFPVDPTKEDKNNG